MKKIVLTLLLLLTSSAYSETINGYTLPPEPNSTMNNSTLFGIDSNKNGVRDDVERYIIMRFQGFENALVDRSIALQYAKATQIVIQNPEMAWENKTYEVMEKVSDCKWYYYDTYLKDIKSYREGALYRQQHRIFDAELKDKIFNTRERLEAYLNYNDDLSGHVFDDSDENKEKCDFDIDSLLKGNKKTL